MMSADETTTARRRAARTPLRKLVLASYAATGIVIGVGAACGFGYVRYHVVVRDMLFEHIRAAGEPVQVADLAIVDGPGPRATEWLRAACGLNAPTFTDAPQITAADLERGLDAEQLMHLEAEDDAHAAFVELAFAARGLDPIREVDWIAVRESWRLPYGPWGDGSDVFSEALTTRARRLSVRGDFVAACAAARAILDVAALWRTPCSREDVFALASFDVDYLQACEDVLRLAPASFDTDSALPVISAQPLRDALRFATYFERAELNGRYAQGLPEPYGELPSGWRRVRWEVERRLFFVRAQTFYLAEYERALTAIELPRRDRRALEEHQPDTRCVLYGHATGWPLSGTRHALEAIDEVAARIELLRIARTARRSGVSAAREILATAIDPATGTTFRAERRDGRLHVESVRPKRTRYVHCSQEFVRRDIALELDWRDE